MEKRSKKLHSSFGNADASPEEKEAQRWQRSLDTKFIPSLNRFKYSNKEKIQEKEHERKELESFLILMNEKMFHSKSILDKPSFSLEICQSSQIVPFKIF